jgi:hypothetical protein
MGCLGRLILILLLIGFIASFGDDSDDSDDKNKTVSKTQSTQETTKTSTPPPTPKETINIPSSQRRFIDFHKKYSKKYSSTSNALKKSALRVKRNEELETIIDGNLNVSDWIGVIDGSPATTTQGNAHFRVKLYGSNIKVGTDNNEINNFINNTLIPKNSSLFNTLSELEDGNKIVFSGVFFRGLGNKDYLDERSITEGGSMKKPEFNFKFTELKKYS